MYNNILHLKKYMSSAINKCKNKYKFRKHHNHNKNRKIDNFYSNDLNKNIPNIITCFDFIYFTCRQSFKNLSYSKTNDLMVNEHITNVSVDAYKKQRKRKSYLLFRDLFYSLFDYYNKNCADSNMRVPFDLINDSMSVDDAIRFSEKLMSVDGSQYSLLKNLANDGISKSSNGKYCRTLVSTIFKNSEKIPYNIKLDKNRNEIRSFIEQIDEIQEYAVYLFDRNYFCQEILQKILDRKCDAVFRLSVRSNFVKKFMKSKNKDKISYLKGSKQVRYDTENAIKVRLIKYTIGDELYMLCTTLIDKNKYSYELLKTLYYKRWDVEIFYKILNINLGLKYSNAKTVNTFQQELYAKLIIIILSKIINCFSLKYSTKPLNFFEQIDFDNCMTTVMHHIFKLLLYGTNKTDNISEICRHIQIIRKSIINCEPYRNYERIAVRAAFKWHHLKYINDYTHRNKKVHVKYDIG